MSRPARALGAVSGGLDSLLAVRLIQAMGIELQLLHFVTGFEPRQLRHELAGKAGTAEPPPELVALGAPVEVIDLRAELRSLLAAPPHGFGAQLNPCLDCKILMLRRARERMESSGADFVFTGDVLGQRPMSQRRQAMDRIDRCSGLQDRLLRPLSGALLPTALPEREGLYRREQLLDLQGRSRRRQEALAAELGVRDYPTPAGGCLLADPAYARRLRNLLERRSGVLREDDPLLAYLGRHVLLRGGALAVIGRQHEENLAIARFADRGHLLEARDFNGPTALVEAPADSQDLIAAARLTARYGQGRERERVVVGLGGPEGRREIDVQPGEPDGIGLL
ncbi:MAG: hypothetical protein JXR96_27535 [Deltaproteobacteria bacterium]|nr:hypothetical protein [Deltaproteobacteria bacterium]